MVQKPLSRTGWQRPHLTAFRLARRAFCQCLLELMSTTIRGLLIQFGHHNVSASTPTLYIREQITAFPGRAHLGSSDNQVSQQVKAMRTSVPTITHGLSQTVIISTSAGVIAHERTESNAKQGCRRSHALLVAVAPPPPPLIS